jgi:hypothetical protein
MAKKLYKGKWVESVDMTPTWSEVVGIYIRAIRDSEPSSVAFQAAQQELFTMAKLADERNEMAKKLNG